MKFRKRPVVIDAVEWTGSNEDDLREFAGTAFQTVEPEDRTDDPDITAVIYDRFHSTWIGVKPSQWIIRGIKGEYYPIEASVLFETYDRVDG